MQYVVHYVRSANVAGSNSYSSSSLNLRCIMLVSVLSYVARVAPLAMERLSHINSNPNGLGVSP